MDPQRKLAAGPMAPTSAKRARKSFAVTDTFIKMPEKEVVNVHTSTPNVEKKSYGAAHSQVFQGQVNILSIIASNHPSNKVMTPISFPRLRRRVGMAGSRIEIAKRDSVSGYIHLEFSIDEKTSKANLLSQDTNKEIMCCKYTEDENDIAAGFIDGMIRLFNCNTGICTYSLVDDECRAYPGPVTAIKHRPISKAHPITNMLLASYVNGCVKCWKYKYKLCLYTIREKRQTLGLSYHPRNSKFITYGDDAKLNMYDEEAQTQERAFYSSGTKGVADGHLSRIFAVAFNPKSHHELISGGWDDTVICWDDRQPYATRKFFGVHLCGEGLDFDKPGRQILTCAWQEKNCIQLWDYGSCKLIETIEPDIYPSKLYCGKFVPKTNLIVCGGSDANILRVVDTNMKITECSIRNNPGEIYSFDFGTIRRKPRKVPETHQKINETEFVPRVAFVSGKRLQTVDFGWSTT